MRSTVMRFIAVQIDWIGLPSCSCYCVYTWMWNLWMWNLWVWKPSMFKVAVISTLGTSWHRNVRMIRKLRACSFTQMHAHSHYFLRLEQVVDQSERWWINSPATLVCTLKVSL